MAEAGNKDQVRAIQWLTAGGRACCTLSQQGEGVFQNCAAYGLYPTAMPGGPLGRLADRYWPLLALGRGKQWIFHPHALELAPGTKGNIYRLSDGNVLAVMVTDGHSVDGSVVDLDVPLVVRLPDAAAVRAAYFLSPDLEGLRRLGFHRDGEKLQIAVPRHRSVSAVLLATGGAHYALEGPMAVAVNGKTDAHLVIDNWTAKPLVGRVWPASRKNRCTSPPANRCDGRSYSSAAMQEPTRARASMHLWCSTAGHWRAVSNAYTEDAD